MDARLAVERRLIAVGVRVTVADEEATFAPSLGADVDEGPARGVADVVADVDELVLLAAVALEKYECRLFGVEPPAPEDAADCAADSSLSSCRLDLIGCTIGERSCAAMRRAFIQMSRSSLHEAIISISYSPVFSLNELDGVARGRSSSISAP